MNKSEQWLSDGDCSLCRRKDYCKRPCKRAELRKKDRVANYIFNKTEFGRFFQKIIKGW